MRYVGNISMKNNIITQKSQIYYSSKLKVLPYFGNVMHNSPALDVFAGVMKMINHTGQWDTKLTWYSTSVTCKNCLVDLEYGLRIYIFRLTWSYLIIEILATSAKISCTIWLLKSI